MTDLMTLHAAAVEATQKYNAICERNRRIATETETEDEPYGSVPKALRNEERDARFARSAAVNAFQTSLEKTDPKPANLRELYAAIETKF